MPKEIFTQCTIRKSSKPITPSKKLVHPKRIKNPHDRLFKRTLRDISVAKDFFDIHLPADLKPYCDLSSLRLSDTSYVEEAYKENLSDVVYQANIKDAPGYLYCVIEHVSEPGMLTPFQVLKYQVSIMQQHLEQLSKSERKKAKLPVVIGLLFYRGRKSPYPCPIDIMECFFSPELARKVFLRPLPLIDLSVIPDEELESHKSVALLELLQKHIDDREQLEYKFRNWLEKDNLHTFVSMQVFEMMIKYILDVNRPKDINQFIKVTEHSAIDEEYLKTMQTISQFLEKKGIEKGIEQGMEKGMEKGMRAGFNQAKRQHARELLLVGVDPFVVQKGLKLTDQELKDLLS